jgi:hypothetical protein
MSISQPFTMKPVDLWEAASHLPTSSTGPTTTKCVTHVLISFCYRCPDSVQFIPSLLTSVPIGAGAVEARLREHTISVDGVDTVVENCNRRSCDS